MGEREARRYMLTAEVFDAAEAFRIGMVHKVTTRDELTDEGLKMARILTANGPKAIAACKELISFVARGPLDQAMIEGTAQRIANIRITEEGQEGLASFFEKRKPNWVKP